MSNAERKSAVGQGLQLIRAAGPIVPAGELLDCWNRTGIEGDGSCPELLIHVHCRNCPVYAAAGSRFLNRLQPDGYKQEWTEYIAQARKPPSAHKISTVIFRLGDEWLALPTQTFQEVTEQRLIHSIPHSGHGIVLGIVNVRGELLLCVSIARLLGLDRASTRRMPSYCGRLLVFASEGGRLTFPVDEVHGLHRLQPEDLSDPAPKAMNVPSTFARGVFSWEKRIVGLLEPQRIFSIFNRSLP